jgi:hypothetical protein
MAREQLVGEFLIQLARNDCKHHALHNAARIGKGKEIALPASELAEDADALRCGGRILLSGNAGREDLGRLRIHAQRDQLITGGGESCAPAIRTRFEMIGASDTGVNALLSTLKGDRGGDA